MNKKYLPSALILYLNYFIHGVGCSILGQAVIKEALAASWGVETMAITAIAAALGLGRLIALPFAGPLSDKLGRRISTAIGSASYAIYLIGLAFAFNAGTNGGYTIAMILIGFTCTGTFQLWLNCAQNFAKENVGWADPSIMQTWYSAGTLIALVVTALLTRKIKDVRFIVIYPVICLVTLIVVLSG